MVSPQQFSSYLRKPYDLDAAAAADLRSILEQHPYFSNAHLLLARSLHNQKSPAFDDALKQATMFAGERPLLYKLVNVEEKEAAPLEKHFDTPAPVSPAPTPIQEKEPVAETIENTAADTYQEPEQTAIPAVEAVEDIAIPKVETTSEHTETEDFELPVTLENTETVNEELPTPPTIDDSLEENSEPTEAETIENQNEEEKLKSAYEEIFGNTDNKDEDISTDFESFDEDDDFVLLIDDNETVETPTVETVEVKNSVPDTETAEKEDDFEPHTHFNLAPETNSLNQEHSTEEAASLADQEEFEAEIGNRLDNDGDGIITPANIDNTPEEEFELNVADAIAASEHYEAVAQNSEDIAQEANEPQNDNEFEIGDSLEDTADNIIIPVPDDDTEEEDFDLNLSAIEYAESEQDQDIVKMMEQSMDEAEEKPSFETFEESTLEPIAFKLDSKITPQETAPSESAVEPEISEDIEEVIAQTKEVEKEKAVEEETETTTGESVLLDQNTFFEWLGQLQNLQADSEKKNTPTEQPKEAEKVENTTPAETKVAETKAESISTPPPVAEPATPPKKSSTVDDIINRFISINPTISRPKAEFYNPTIKSKESDTERDDLATETLAKIYSEQQLTEKAIDIYQRLIKLHPQKTEQYKAAIAELEGSN